MQEANLTPAEIEQARKAFIDERVSIWFMEPPTFDPHATLYFRILDELTRDLASHAIVAGAADPDALKEKYHDAEGLFGWLQSYAADATGQQSDSEGWWNLWRHIPVEPRGAGDWVFPLATTDLKQLSEMTSVYLAQPARSRLLDRTLVDMLVAFEVFHLANALYWKPNIHGLTQHALDGRPPRSLLASLIWFVGLVALTSFGLILSTLVLKVALGAGAAFDPLLIAGFAIAGAVIVVADRCFAARRKIGERVRCVHLCDRMFVAYRLLRSDEIAASEVARAVLEAAQDGAIWPAALLGLLSDTVERKTKL